MPANALASQPLRSRLWPKAADAVLKPAKSTSLWCPAMVRRALPLLLTALSILPPCWLARRGLLGLLPLPARADVIRLQQRPLPKAYRDSVVPAAQALKEALEAEETAGDAFIGAEAEKTLGHSSFTIARGIRSGLLLERSSRTFRGF